mgnify:FL=1
MNFLFDLFPVILFFAAFKLADIYVATAVTIAATFVQIAWTWLRTRKVSGMLWTSFAIVTLFGGMTLFLRDETFIKWKPTVLYWALSSAFIIGRLLGKNLIRGLLGAQLTLPDAVWNRLNWAWTGFFAFMGLANLAVAFLMGLSTAAWVNFKLFGSMGMTLAFVLAQGLMLAKYIENDEKEPSSSTPDTES